MLLAEIPQTLQKALGFHEALRRVGFRSSDIFLRLHEQRLSVAVVQQEVAFVIGDAGTYDGDEKALALDWANVAAAVNSGAMSDEDVHSCLLSAVPKDRGAEFMLTLLSGGLHLPNKMAN